MFGHSLNPALDELRASIPRCPYEATTICVRGCGETCAYILAEAWAYSMGRLTPKPARKSTREHHSLRMTIAERRGMQTIYGDNTQEQEDWPAVELDLSQVAQGSLPF